jgi:hypothetical protein
MHDLLILAALVVVVVVLDLAALRFGVDTREPPDAWW